MTQEDIEKAIELIRTRHNGTDAYRKEADLVLIRVAEAFLKLGNWVSTGLAEGSRDPYDCAMYAVEKRIQELLNPPAKSAFRELVEYIDGMSFANGQTLEALGNIKAKIAEIEQLMREGKDGEG